MSGVPHNPRLRTFVVMDLGMRDAAVAGFFQIESRSEIHVIDYIEKTGMTIPQTCAEFQNRGYVYSNVYLPHDGKVRESQTGKTRVEAFQELGFQVRLVPNVPIMDGVNALRALFPRLWFDKVKCERLIHCLTNYHKRWDPKRACYEEKPFHDWSSNAADMMRYAALIYDWEFESNNTPITSSGCDSSVWSAGDNEDDGERRNGAGGFRSSERSYTLDEYEVEDPVTHRRQKVYR